MFKNPKFYLSDRQNYPFGCLHLLQRPMTFLMKFSDWTMSCQPGLGSRVLVMISARGRASKTFVLFVLCTEAETGYFGGRQAVKGEESQYCLTEPLCLFWIPPWGFHLSPVTNIHIIDRMAFLIPIIENWHWKWYRGIEENTFQANFVFFFRYFPLILCICYKTCMKVFLWKSWLCQE